MHPLCSNHFFLTEIILSYLKATVWGTKRIKGVELQKHTFAKKRQYISCFLNFKEQKPFTFFLFFIF